MMELSSVFFLCLVLTVSGPLVQAGEHKPSKNLYTFLNLLSGYYTNHDQVRFETHNHLVEVHDNSTVLLRPVVVKELHDKITFYLEISFNGKLFKRGLWVISEDHFGVIHVQNLKILSSGSDKPYKPEDVVDYSNIRYQPEHRPQCQGVFYSVDQNVFVGAVPDCPSEAHGVVQKYSVMLTCHSLSLFSCYKGFVHKPRLPLISFKDDSYALPHQITKGAHYPSPCHYE